jgi:hypothetical protein
LFLDGDRDAQLSDLTVVVIDPDSGKHNVCPHPWHQIAKVSKLSIFTSDQ